MLNGWLVNSRRGKGEIVAADWLKRHCGSQLTPCLLGAPTGFLTDWGGMHKLADSAGDHSLTRKKKSGCFGGQTVKCISFILF